MDMDKETANIILQLFGALTTWSQDHWAKLHALEEMLKSLSDHLKSGHT
jgi:hypothetical protein